MSAEYLCSDIKTMLLVLLSIYEDDRHDIVIWLYKSSKVCSLMGYPVSGDIECECPTKSTEGKLLGINMKGVEKSEFTRIIKFYDILLKNADSIAIYNADNVMVAAAFPGEGLLSVMDSRAVMKAKELGFELDKNLPVWW